MSLNQILNTAGIVSCGKKLQLIHSGQEFRIFRVLVIKDGSAARFLSLCTQNSRSFKLHRPRVFIWSDLIAAKIWMISLGSSISRKIVSCSNRAILQNPETQICLFCRLFEFCDRKHLIFDQKRLTISAFVPVLRQKPCDF